MNLTWRVGGFLFVFVFAFSRQAFLKWAKLGKLLVPFSLIGMIQYLYQVNPIKMLFPVQGG